MDKDLKREIILDNYQNPYNKKEIDDDSYIKINTNNESCIDNLDIYFRVEDGFIKDAGFNGEACAISTSATSIMLRNLIGKSVECVKEILNVYDEIYLQPNRKNCAILPAKAVDKLIKELDNAS